MASISTDVATSHPYTCNTCLVAFKNSELQRGHMQSDWHRYNLKRRVASLPPLSSEIFTEKVLASQATAAATAARASFERLCTLCEKIYFSENAYQNHLSSQKHRIRLAQTMNGSFAPTEDETASMVSSAFSLGDSVDTRPAAVETQVAEAEFSEVINGIKKTSLTEVPTPSRPSHPDPSAASTRPAHPLSPSDDDKDPTADGKQDSDDTEALLQCLFCNSWSLDVDENTKHMHAVHGMFIPEQKYLVDREGLLRWLHGRVKYLHECLYCGMIRHTTTGIQTHMRDKGHCMIEFESEEQMVEVGQFYDFRSTYSDDELEEDDEIDDEPKASKLGAKRGVVVNGDTDQDEDMEDGAGWETDDSGSATSDPKDAAVSRPSGQRRVRKSAEPRDVYFDENGLHLPTGRLAGHRSLARYFRQNLHNYPTPEARASRRAIADASAEDMEMDGDSQSVAGRGHDQKAISRANGGLGMLGVSEEKKREAAAIEKADRTRAQRQQNKYQAGNERRANMQKHFRDPLLQ